MRRRLALGMAVLTASGLLALAAPGDAQAAGASCAGRKVRSFSFSTGSVEVYKRRGYVCAVTLPKKPGTRRYMMVSVQVYALQPVVDEGQFTRWAGPRTVHAGRHCVRVKGAVGHGSYESGWILC
ncbi:hypothetical protein ADK57_16660 [Streptomyces sp. MMG1533]|uniref:hypothetical protein n=1 Tax=Streptomyces sp. MMG1533 TaxID=1415546 RepID=UPI0006AE1522|nr:hypothetical protein [Streptomyces sp. MMG1533]KOU67234.1 hypothetical protein ADK57_16660 [Streptomyces sp. MMG1533]